jgi:hypothetical protein
MSSAHSLPLTKLPIADRQRRSLAPRATSSFPLPPLRATDDVPLPLPPLSLTPINTVRHSVRRHPLPASQALNSFPVPGPTLNTMHERLLSTSVSELSPTVAVRKRARSPDVTDTLLSSHVRCLPRPSLCASLPSEQATVPSSSFPAAFAFTARCVLTRFASLFSYFSLLSSA